MTVLSDGEVRSALAGHDLRGWRFDRGEIFKNYKFSTFMDAIAFIDRLARFAEEANHHPDILVHGWNKVRLSLTNHSAGGLTEADFKMAARIDQL